MTERSSFLGICLAATALSLGACASEPTIVRVPVAAPGPPGMSTDQGYRLYQQLQAAQNQLQSSQNQILGLSTDIARLRHDVCVLAVIIEKIQIQTDPNNNRNRVVARDGPIRNPNLVCTQ